VVTVTKAWVVYESMFGNTREVALAVADGLEAWADVEVHEVGQVPTVPGGVDLLVVGGPTHAFGLSRASTREDAARQSGQGVESAGIGLREWFEALSFDGDRAPAAAAFDTRVDHPRVPGSAAKKAAKRLRGVGCREITHAESFWVAGTKGPLVDGEVTRARSWGRELRGCVAGGALQTDRVD
jgi:hypothetical protein